jgi:hypothetical protein
MLEYAESKLKDSQYSNREIYVLTDGQAQALPDKPNIPIIVIPLPKPEPWNNISCENAKPVMQLTDKQQTQLIQFDIINHGASIRKDVLVRVDLNGVKAAEKFVTLQAGQRLTESLPVLITSSGWQSGYVEVLDERLTADNRSWFAFPFELHPKIGVISQRNSLPIILNTVLSVYATAQGSVKIINPQQVNFQQSKDYSLLVMYDAGELSPRLRGFIQDYLKARRGILFCADRDLSASWKAYYGQLFGIQIGGFNTASQPITYVNTYHSVTSLFDAKQLKRSAVADFWNATNNGSANILLASEGSPLAVAGNNSLLWLFDTAGMKSRFLLDASFPVFAFRSMQYLANTQFETEKQTVGQLLTTDELIMPTGDKTELNGNSFKTFEPGVYILNWRGGESQKVAIQPDANESIYTPLTFPKSPNYHILGKNWTEQLFLSRLGHDIWKFCLLAALFLLLLELIIVKSEEWKPANLKS